MVYSTWPYDTTNIKWHDSKDSARDEVVVCVGMTLAVSYVAPNVRETATKEFERMGPI